jgi:formate dehydrogenase maturation protein FdhE
MLGSEIYVQKRGEVYTVHVADNGLPLPVATVDDEPVGAFPFTFTSKKELEAHFPGRQFVMLEAKANNSQVLRYDPEIERQALAILGQKPTNPSTPQTKSITISTNDSGEVLQQGVLSAKQKAEEFLKRLQTALQYASKKHAPKLQHQIEAVEELINEIFKG